MPIFRGLAAIVIGLVLGTGLAQAGNIEAEIGQLEALSRAGKLKPAQADRLAEIYFLTSRCDDVLRLYLKRATSSGRLLLCACGGKCPGNSDLERMTRFRRALETKGSRWQDHKIQALWRKVENLPEARYWALKSLRANPASFRDARLRNLRVDLESSLESLEVRP